MTTGYWANSGSAVALDASTDAAVVYEGAPAAYISQFNRIGAGPICQYAVVTDDATGLNVASGPAIYYGLICTAVGATGCVVYDGVTATGNVLRPLAAGTVNTFYGPSGGIGILCNNGITVDWTDGTWLVLYAPAV